MPATTAANLDEIERTISIATLALASARAALAALRRQDNAQPRDEIGRFTRRILDRSEGIIPEMPFPGP